MEPQHDPGLLRYLLETLAGLYLMLLTWLGKRHVGRLDEIERQQRQSITRDEHARTVEALRSEIQTSSRETHKRLDDILLLLSKRGE